jgi:hypothetical protein
MTLDGQIEEQDVHRLGVDTLLQAFHRMFRASKVHQMVGMQQFD